MAYLYCRNRILISILIQTASQIAKLYYIELFPMHGVKLGFQSQQQLPTTGMRSEWESESESGWVNVNTIRIPGSEMIWYYNWYQSIKLKQYHPWLIFFDNNDTYLILGKRSDTMPLNSLRSSIRNLGTLTSRMARNAISSSLMSGFCRFKLPAAEITDFTALIPKS